MDGVGFNEVMNYTVCDGRWLSGARSQIARQLELPILGRPGQGFAISVSSHI